MSPERNTSDNTYFKLPFAAPCEEASWANPGPTHALTLIILPCPTECLKFKRRDEFGLRWF